MTVTFIIKFIGAVEYYGNSEEVRLICFANLHFYIVAFLYYEPRKRQVSTETCRFQLYSPYGELYAPSVRDICFASDMPASVRGEYNITKTAGFNITFCVAKYITPSKTEYH